MGTDSVPSQRNGGAGKKAAEPRSSGSCRRLSTTCIRYTALIYMCTNTCMLQNTYVDTQGRAPTHPQTLPGLPVPRHNHGTRVCADHGGGDISCSYHGLDTRTYKQVMPHKGFLCACRGCGASPIIGAESDLFPWIKGQLSRATVQTSITSFMLP